MKRAFANGDYRSLEIVNSCFVNRAIWLDYICKDKNAMYMVNVLDPVGSPAVLYYLG